MNNNHDSKKHHLVPTGGRWLTKPSAELAKRGLDLASQVQDIKKKVKTILVVEDDETTCNLICESIRSEEHLVVYALDGQTGLEKYSETKPDLVVTNLHMPSLNGIQLLREIRKVDLITPVILESGFLHLRRFIPGFDDFFDAVFEKPFSLEEMKRCVEQLLSLSRQELEDRHRKVPTEMPSYPPDQDEEESPAAEVSVFDLFVEKFGGAILEAEAESEDAEAWVHKAWTLYGSARYDDALQACEKAISLKSDYAKAWHRKAWILRSLDRYDDALEAFDKAIQLKTDYAKAWIDKAMTLRGLGREDEALQALDKVTKLEPDDFVAWYAEGETLRNLGRDNEAIQAYEKAIRLNPEVAPAWNRKGVALRNLGRYDEALRAYEKAVELDPDYTDAWYERACVHSVLGQKEDALTMLRKAIALDSKFLEMARTDPNFENLKNNKDFKRLIKRASRRR